MLKPNEKILLEKLSKEKYNEISFSIDIRTIKTDINFNFSSGIIFIDYPVFLFGLNDFYGGYKISNSILQPPKGNVYLGSFFYNITNQKNVPNNLTFLKTGDLVSLYFDNNYNHYIFVVQSCVTTPFYTLINTLNNRFNTNKVKMFVDGSINNEKQFEEPFTLYKINPIGQFITSSFSPYMYLTTRTPQSNMIEFNWEFKINENFGILFTLKANALLKLTFTGTW
jgi:hypothetical protein